MSKKFKNKGGKSTTSKSQGSALSTNVVTEEQKKRISELKEDVEQKMEERKLEIEELNEENAAKIAEAEKNNDLKKYLKELESIHRQLITLYREASSLKESAQQESEKIKGEKNQLEEDKKTVSKRTDALNKKEKEVLERELQLDNGEYTGTIRSLLNALNNSEKEIADETKKLIEDIAVKHKELLQREKELGESTFNLEDEKNAIEKDRQRLAKKERNLEADAQLYREEAKEELEAEYSGRLDEEKNKSARLQKRNEFLESKIAELETLKSSLFVTFGDKEPEDILSEVNKIRKEIVTLKEELNKRPTEEDLETQRQENGELEVELHRLRGLVNEKEILELRTRINNTDSYVIEIQGYKDRLESSKNREDSLKRTIEDLKSTVEQLKGEHQKDEEAFHFARKYDSDVNVQNKGFHDNPPANMQAFAVYMQEKMASSEKPFYYDLDTVRIFIAGLSMSNISILQGISGTGKTSLPREFAKAIISEAMEYRGNNAENTPNAPYRICAVQSGWRDNMDLMGYYNSFEHKYKETDFFKALYLANLPKYSNTLFFIILDEMNLSRPEHYFADFLSLLEQEEDERYITINAPDEVLPKQIVQGKLKVPANVRFIGTANHDETTLEFAPKTYDRSNLMEMPKNKQANIRKTEDAYNISYSWLKKQFLSAKDSYQAEYDKFKKFINSEEMRELLMEKGIGIGNRLEDQAERFICTFVASGDPKKKEESLATAADHLITTRLFRTLRNRYDLEKNTLQIFKEKYIELFRNQFNYIPRFADRLLTEEIEKK